MKIEGQHTFAAPRQLVWDAVLDPEVLARVLPGCEDFRDAGGGEFEGTLKIKVGPVQGKFKGKVTLSDLTEPESYQLRVQGKGPAGFVDGSGELRLEEADGGTELHYAIDAKVGGRIASVGQRLLDSSSKVITRQAMDGLEQQILARTEAAGGVAEEAAAELPAAPSQGEMARGFARGMLDELVPRRRRPLVFGTAAVILVAAVWLLARACGG